MRCTVDRAAPFPAGPCAWCMAMAVHGRLPTPRCALHAVFRMPQGVTVTPFRVVDEINQVRGQDFAWPVLKRQSISSQSTACRSTHCKVPALDCLGPGAAHMCTTSSPSPTAAHIPLMSAPSCCRRAAPRVRSPAFLARARLSLSPPRVPSSPGPRTGHGPR